MTSRHRPPALGLLLAAICSGCGSSVPPTKTTPIATSDVAALHAQCQRLVALHQRPPPTQPGDWLAEHAEAGQTFAEYLDEAPRLATGARRKIYVMPIGSFDAARQDVLDRTLEALTLWFGLEVEVEDTVQLAAIPAGARREFPGGGWLQLHAGHLMKRVLRPNLPADAACRIGFVANDLWPGRGWNFVFGQASLRDRIGVWSLWRNGDPADGDAAKRLCLLRTLKTATHEIGHMFGMRHCTAWACNLAGSNHRDESDRQPWRLCPECLPKLMLATGVQAPERFDALAEFSTTNELREEADWFRSAARLLRQ